MYNKSFEISSNIAIANSSDKEDFCNFIKLLYKLFGYFFEVNIYKFKRKKKHF